MIGQRFGLLVVLSTSARTPDGHSALEVRCDCGRVVVRPKRRLISGDTRSCGCATLRLRSESLKVHGGTGTREHGIWSSMKSRCENPKAISYPLYGARGITVCDRWRRDFAAFLADMGPCPSPDHSIDRIDSAGHYEPGNCRWATEREQQRNRRSNHRVTFGGETLCVAEWAERIGITYSALKSRLQKGWSVERALTESTRPWAPGRPKP